MDLQVTLGPGPRRAQLEQQLRDGVRTGRLRPGTPLPPSRTLSRELGVSRGVVVEAYAQLVAEGYLVARRGAGTRVASPPAQRKGSDPSARGMGSDPHGRPVGSDPHGHAVGSDPRRAARGSDPRAEGGGSDPAVAYDLRTGRVDLSLFPRRAWLGATARALKDLPDAAFDYGDPRGHEPLRAALAAHLGRARGVLADPDCVIVCGGLYQGVPVLWRALAAHGVRRVAVEDPGWRGQSRTVQLAGLEAVPVPVDERGIQVDRLGDVDAVVVTPAHQFPTGVVLAPERRAELVAWARERDAVIVEDDYDAEYRYDREPVGSIQGLAPDHVVYAGSASKTLAPGLRLGWLLAPGWLAGDLAREKDLNDRGTPVLEQAALADLLERGEIDRHLRRTRRRYRDRRDALVVTLEEQLPQARIGGAAAGLHVVAWLPGDADEHAIVGAAARRGVAVHGLHGTCTVASPRPPALLLGYAATHETRLVRAARELAAATAAARSASASPRARAARPSA